MYVADSFPYGALDGGCCFAWMGESPCAFSLPYCAKPRFLLLRRDRFEHPGSRLSMFVRSFSPFLASTDAEFHGECTLVECRPPRMFPCFQAMDRFCSTFALLILSKKRHKNRHYVCSFEQKQLILHEDRKRRFESKYRIATFQPYRLYSS
jgi:hypothetical protein